MHSSIVESFLFQPPDPYSSPKPCGRQAESRFVETKDAKIHCFYFRCSSSTSDNSNSSSSNISLSEKPMTLLYSHGNAEDIRLCHNNLVELSRAVGADIFAYDYCGYGFSKCTTQKRPTEERVYKDADAVYAELTSKMGVPPQRVILVGRSMGGGPTCYLASKHHTVIAGVILISTFTSVFGAINSRFLRCLRFLRDPFPNEKYMQKVDDCSVLLLHGVKDNVVDFRCSQKLKKVIEKAQSRQIPRATLECCWFGKCGHNDIEEYELSKFLSVLTNFVQRVARLAASSNRPGHTWKENIEESF